MAKKYQELYEEMRNDVEQARELMRKEKALRAEARTLYAEAEFAANYRAALEAADAKNDEAEKVYDEVISLLDWIHQAVDQAYELVPFAGPAQQGIKRFWELAGIPQNF